MRVPRGAETSTARETQSNRVSSVARTLQQVSARIRRLPGVLLLCGILCRRMALRFFRSRFGINGFAALDVSAEAEAHGREHLFAEGVLLPRAESSVLDSIGD